MAVRSAAFLLYALSCEARFAAQTLRVAIMPLPSYLQVFIDGWFASPVKSISTALWLLLQATKTASLNAAGLIDANGLPLEGAAKKAAVLADVTLFVNWLWPKIPGNLVMTVMGYLSYVPGLSLIDPKGLVIAGLDVVAEFCYSEITKPAVANAVASTPIAGGPAS